MASSSWVANFANIPYNYSRMEDNLMIDELFGKEKKDIDVIKMIELKESIMNIIQKKEIIDWEEGDTSEEKEKDDIDKLYEGIQQMIPIFNQNQEDLHIISEEFQKELQILRNNVSTVENMINFLKKLPEEQKNEESMKVIIENMNQLCKKIMNNDVINAIKERYIVKRKEIEKHIKFIKLLNNFNVCNTCPICLTQTIDHFFDPCGHTFCKKCVLKSLKKEEDKDLYLVGREGNSICPLCREKVKSVKQLYIL